MADTLNYFVYNYPWAVEITALAFAALIFWSARSYARTARQSARVLDDAGVRKFFNRMDRDHGH